MGLFDGFFGPPAADQQAAPQGGGLLGNSPELANYLNNNQQSLMGLGLGLMSGNRGMGDALAGYQAGAKQDLLSSLQAEKRKQDQNSRAAALAFAKSKGLSPDQTAMLVANPDIAAHVLQAQLTPEKQSMTDKLLAGMNPQQVQDWIANQTGKNDKDYKPQWGVIGETTDQFGNPQKQYGWVRPNDQTVAPYGGQVASPAGAGVALGGQPTATGKVMPDGSAAAQQAVPPPPPGVNPKVWYKKAAEAAADKQFGSPESVNPYAPPGKLTEAQAKDIGYANRAAAAHKQIIANEDAGLSRSQQALSGVPMVGNSLIGSKTQLLNQAQDNYLNAILRRESGASISPSEFEVGRRQYFPQPGDTPEMLAQKRKNREDTAEGIMAGAGPNYKPPAAYLELKAASEAGAAKNAPTAPRGLGGVTKSGVRFSY